METTSAEKAEKELSFHHLADSLKSCQRCRLPDEFRPIFTRFTGQRWMLIGQAPGIKEQKSGTLFIGPAGRRLFKWLAAAGLDEKQFRSICYITAMIKCFPGKGLRGDLKPSRRQLASCAGWLAKEMAAVQPEVIIPVGQLAIEHFLGKVKLEQVVGKRLISRIGARGAVIIPLPHPSGASAWANTARNQRLIKKAVDLIRREASRFQLQ